MSGKINLINLVQKPAEIIENAHGKEIDRAVLKKVLDRKATSFYINIDTPNYKDHYRLQRHKGKSYNKIRRRKLSTVL